MVSGGDSWTFVNNVSSVSSKRTDRQGLPFQRFVLVMAKSATVLYLYLRLLRVLSIRYIFPKVRVSAVLHIKIRLKLWIRVHGYLHENNMSGIAWNFQ